MEEQPNRRDRIAESTRFKAASRQLMDDAKQRIDTAKRRLDRTRNLLQLTILLRALRARLPRR